MIDMTLDPNADNPAQRTPLVQGSMDFKDVTHAVCDI